MEPPSATLTMASTPRDSRHAPSTSTSRHSPSAFPLSINSLHGICDGGGDVVAAVVHDFHDKIKLLQQRVAWRLACAGLARPRPLRKMTEPNGSIKTQSMMMPTHAAPREGQERAVQAFQCPLRLCARVEGHDGPAALFPWPCETPCETMPSLGKRWPCDTWPSPCGIWPCGPPG